MILRLNSIAAAHLEERARDVAKIQTRTDAERRSRLVRAKILAMIGNLPETRSALNPKSAGAALDRDGFRIEKVIFESLPAFYVTANVYVPASGTAPFPAVVMTPGHSPTGKAGEYQLAANFARNGIVALAYDPMSEGERLQYFDPATGKSAVGGPTGEHSQAALADDLTGEHISRYFVWDAMRAIDYLITRKDIDAGRIGAFGCSGGGTVTAYLTALDPRVKAAATACYITAFQDLLAAPTGVQEAEQTIPGFIAAGFDFPDWVELAAPRPYAIVSTTNDMFPFEGARKSYEEARRIYGLYGAADKLQWITGPGGHGALTPVHPEILAFFLRALKDSSDTPSYTRLTPDKPADLYCTPTGQVTASLGGETIASIIRRVRPARTGVDFRGPAGIAAQPGTERAVVTLEPEFMLHSEEGIDLPGRWIAPRSAAKKPAVVLLSGEVPEGLASPDRVVLALAPRPSPSARKPRNRRCKAAFTCSPFAPNSWAKLCLACAWTISSALSTGSPLVPMWTLPPSRSMVRPAWVSPCCTPQRLTRASPLQTDTLRRVSQSDFDQIVLPGVLLAFLLALMWAQKHSGLILSPARRAFKSKRLANPG